MKEWSAYNIESQADTADDEDELRLLDNFIMLVNDSKKKTKEPQYSLAI